MLPLMLALLLQLLNFTGDNAFSFNVTPGTDLTLNFKGFGADDKIQVVQTPGRTPPRFSLVIGGSGLIKYGAFQKIKAATVQQSGNTLTFTPASDGPRVVVVRLPSAMPVHITQNGVTMPFNGELYIEGSYHSQEKNGVPAQAVRYGQDQIGCAQTVPKGPPNQFLHGNAQTLQQMVQSLLADRFKLALHRETKEMPVYALIFAVLLSRRLSLRLSSCPIGPILSHGHGNPCCARPDMEKEK